MCHLVAQQSPVILQACEGSKWYMFDPVSWERNVTTSGKTEGGGLRLDFLGFLDGTTS